MYYKLPGIVAEWSALVETRCRIIAAGISGFSFNYCNPSSRIRLYNRRTGSLRYSHFGLALSSVRVRFELYLSYNEPVFCLGRLRILSYTGRSCDLEQVGRGGNNMLRSLYSFNEITIGI